MKVALIPSSMKEFSCIGTACEDHCCKDWNINIDQLSYVKLKSSANPEIKEISKNTYKKKEKPTKDVYGNITQNENKECSFLDDNKLCKIHKLLGESYLCDTCSIYPKLYKKVGESVEKSLSLSCPEATRVLINQPQGIEFEEVQLASSERIKFMNLVTTDKADILWEIRIFTISILQQNGFTIEEKLKIIGLLTEMLRERELTLPIVQLTIQSIIMKIENGSLNNLLQKTTNVELQYTFYKEALCVLAEELSVNVRLVESINEFILGFKTGPLGAATLTEDELLKYQEVEKLYAAFMEKHDYILENYFVHYVYTFNFPFSQTSILESYLEMFLNYQILTALFKGSIALNGELSLNSIVKSIQSFTKATAHNPYGLELLRDRIKEKKYDNLSFLYALI